MDFTPRVSNEDWTFSQDEFLKKFYAHFYDPSFQKESAAIEKIAMIAWENYQSSRKAPLRQKAGDGFSDPTYELSQEWIKAKKDIDEAQKRYEDKNVPKRVLLISGSHRNDQTCPGEISKSSRLIEQAKKSLEQEGVQVKILDLSLVTSEYGKTIHPCKGCLSTAMPLCHWPCSCYPHHSLGQIHDWMNEIYPMWIEALGIFIITPVYWLQVPSALKLMIDRLVCADGGNPDPTTTQGKKAELAKKMDKNWHYPKHLSGRFFSVFVHGDTEGIDQVKDHLSNWLEALELRPAAPVSRLARFIGYFEEYSQSHQTLDKDEAIFQEIRNLSVSLAYNLKTAPLTHIPEPKINDPRPK